MALRRAWTGFRRPGRPEADAAERLLDTAAETAGAPGHSPGDAPLRPRGETAPHHRVGVPSPEPLAELLAAAAAPARPDELAGEEAAVAAFRAIRQAHDAATAQPATAARAVPAAADQTPPVPPGRAGLGRRAWPAGAGRPRRRLTAGAAVWVAVAVATITTGAAVAAESGILKPTPPSDPTSTRSRATTAAPPTASPTTAPVEAPGVTPSGTPGATPAGPTRVPPAPSVVGKCRGYLARNAGPGRAPAKTPPPELVEAAGGAAEVEAYCRTLLEADPGRGRDGAGSGKGNGANNGNGDGKGKGNGTGNGTGPGGNRGRGGGSTNGTGTDRDKRCVTPGTARPVRPRRAGGSRPE